MAKSASTGVFHSVMEHVNSILDYLIGLKTAVIDECNRLCGVFLSSSKKKLITQQYNLLKTIFIRLSGKKISVLRGAIL